MITYIAQLPIKPEHQADFEAMMDDICATIKANEPGVPYYAWSKSLEDPNLYLVVEVYKDVESHTAHMETPWVKESLPKSGAMLGGKPDIKQYVTPGSEPVRKRYT